MAIEKIGFNITALNNITPPVLDINYTAVGFLNMLPQNADTMTGGTFAYFVLAVLFIVTYWYLSDKSDLAVFRYSDLRALTIALTFTGSMGVMLVMSGFVYSWVAVTSVLLGALFCNIFLIIQDNKQ